MNPEMIEAMIAGARRAGAEAIAALAVAAVRGLKAQVARLGRAWWRTSGSNAPGDAPEMRAAVTARPPFVAVATPAAAGRSIRNVRPRS